VREERTRELLGEREGEKSTELFGVGKGAFSYLKKVGKRDLSISSWRICDHERRGKEDSSFLYRRTIEKRKREGSALPAKVKQE